MRKLTLLWRVASPFGIIRSGKVVSFSDYWAGLKRRHTAIGMHRVIFIIILLHFALQILLDIDTVTQSEGSRQSNFWKGPIHNEACNPLLRPRDFRQK